MPLIGELEVSGLSVTQLEQQLAEAYRTVMPTDSGMDAETNVNVEILTYRPFYILGDVSKPGSYPYQSGLTVLRAVALAGGYASSGPEARVEAGRFPLWTPCSSRTAWG